jgi:hypothetical protein
MTSPIKLNVDAKAEAKFSVKGKVPSKSLGRLVDAFTDMIRPFSEARGLKADQIRLQREEVVFEVARRARERLLFEKAPIQPVSSKVLIPLIEKASLEAADDDDMIQRWSDLLANASKDQKVEPRYVQILSELTSRQARLFDEVVNNAYEEISHPGAWLEDAPIHLGPTWVRRQINQVFVDRKSIPSADFIYNKVLETINYPGCAIIDLILSRANDDFYSMPENKLVNKGFHRLELDLEIIASLGILKRSQVFYTTKFKDDIHLIYYHITELGLSFLKAVKKVSVEDASEAIAEAG